MYTRREDDQAAQADKIPASLFSSFIYIDLSQKDNSDMTVYQTGPSSFLVSFGCVKGVFDKG